MERSLLWKKVTISCKTFSNNYNGHVQVGNTIQAHKAPFKIDSCCGFLC